MDENKLFYVGLKAFIERDGKLLVMQEAPGEFEGGKWELPGGRIQHAEVDVSFEDVLLREIAEECGPLQVKVGGIAGIFRRHFGGTKWVFLVGFRCAYISGEVKLSSEHLDFAWISQEEMAKYEFVSGYKEAIEEYFHNKQSQNYEKRI